MTESQVPLFEIEVEDSFKKWMYSFPKKELLSDLRILYNLKRIFIINTRNKCVHYQLSGFQMSPKK